MGKKKGTKIDLQDAKIPIIYDEDYHEIYVDGGQGFFAVSQEESSVIKFGLYSDNLVYGDTPEVNVERTIKTSLTMTVPVAKKVATWILENIDQYEKDSK